jgi:tRNA A58 N-methylase Trm61
MCGAVYKKMFNCLVRLTAGRADGGVGFGDFVKVLCQGDVTSAELKEEDCETAWENVGSNKV